MLSMVGQYHDRLHDRRLEVLDEDSFMRILEQNPDSSTISVAFCAGKLESMTCSHVRSFACASAVLPVGVAESWDLRSPWLLSITPPLIRRVHGLRRNN